MKSPVRGAGLVFLDESGFMLTSTVRRTYAPCGHTPIIRNRDRRDRISAISAITVSPVRERLGLYFYLLPDDENVHAEDTVRFLQNLRLHLRKPMTLIWDRGNVHDRALVVREFLEDHSDIQAVRLPPYAPELNPDEQVWRYSKYSRLANYVPETTRELRRKITAELQRLRRRPDLLAGFIRHTGLPWRSMGRVSLFMQRSIG